MRLAPSSDWFNAFTSALIQGINGMAKSMDDFFWSANSLENLETVLDQFFEKCEELGVKNSTKKFKYGQQG